MKLQESPSYEGNRKQTHRLGTTAAAALFLHSIRAYSAENIPSTNTTPELAPDVVARHSTVNAPHPLMVANPNFQIKPPTLQENTNAPQRAHETNLSNTQTNNTSNIEKVNAFIDLIQRYGSLAAALTAGGVTLGALILGFKGIRAGLASSLVYGLTKVTGEGLPASVKIGTGSVSIFELMGKDPRMHWDMYWSYVRATRRPHLPVLTFSEIAGKRIFEALVRHLNDLINGQELVRNSAYISALTSSAATRGITLKKGDTLEILTGDKLKLFLSIPRTRGDFYFFTYDCDTTKHLRYGRVGPEDIVDILLNTESHYQEALRGSTLRQFVRTLEAALTVMARDPQKVLSQYIENAYADFPVYCSTNGLENAPQAKKEILEEIRDRKARFQNALHRVTPLLPLLTTHQDESVQSLELAYERDRIGACTLPESARLGAPLTREGIAKILDAWCKHGYKKTLSYLPEETTLSEALKTFEERGLAHSGAKYMTTFNYLPTDRPPNYIRRPS